MATIKEELQGTTVDDSQVDCEKASISDSESDSSSGDDSTVSSQSSSSSDAHRDPDTALREWDSCVPPQQHDSPGHVQPSQLHSDKVTAKPVEKCRSSPAGDESTSATSSPSHTVPLPVCPSEVNRNLIEFTNACKLLCEKIIQLESKYGDVLVPGDLLRDLKQSKLSMDEKTIMVNVFGEQNCGKSTFLNALLGYYCLPVERKSCTALIVKIQHSDEVHPMCDESRATTKGRPTLHELRKSGKTVMTGRDAIYKHLQGLNKKFRCQPHNPESQETVEVPNLVLKVHLPILNEGCPDGWTVTLVDNPGFGEDKQYITQLASASLVTSSAYIYLMTIGSVSGTAASEFFKRLQEKDLAALCDGRLIIGITQVDTLYDDGNDRPETLTEEEVVEDLLKSIESATGTKVGKSVVVPISARWNLDDRELTRWLRDHSDYARKPREIVKAAVKALEKRHRIPPIGQDETVKEMIKKMSSKQLLQILETSDGLSVMKARIHDVIGKACIKTWAKKLYSNFLDYCKNIYECIGQACEERDRDIKCKEEAYTKARELIDDLERMREELVNEMKSESAVTLEKLGESYYRDVEHSKAPETGKMVTSHLVTKFKTECQERFKAGEFKSSEFQACVKEFLIESRPKLQTVFGECSFKRVDACIANLNEDTVKRIGQMEEVARRLLGHDHPRATPDSQVDNHEESTFVQTEATYPHDVISSSVQNRVLNQCDTYAPSDSTPEENSNIGEDSSDLEEVSTEETVTSSGMYNEDYIDEHRELSAHVTHLRDMYGVPEVSLSWWKALQIVAKDIWDQLKQKATHLYTSINESPEDAARTDRDVSDVMNTADAPSRAERFDDSFKSTRLVDERCHEHDTTPQSDGRTPVGDTHTAVSTVTVEPAVIDPTTSISIPGIYSSANMPTEELDDILVSESVESGVVIDKWGDEVLLESAISRIQNVLEEECDKYFKDIAPDAIKFFHEKYQMKIKTSLAKFDKEYKAALGEKAKEIKKVKERETALRKKIAIFREHENALLKLEEKLHATWEGLGWTLEGHDTRTPEQIEAAIKFKEDMELKWTELAVF